LISDESALHVVCAAQCVRSFKIAELHTFSQGVEAMI
jgi:hypothetical protein